MLKAHRFDCNHSIRRMRFLSHHLLRGFIFLLLAVFIANTVYASGMMAAGQLHALADNQIVQRHAAGSSTAEAHCHQQFASDATLQHQQYQQHHQHKHSCNDCNHCFACFTMAIQSTPNHIFNPEQLISSIQFAEIYLSPISAQPQKPPIV